MPANSRACVIATLAAGNSSAYTSHRRPHQVNLRCRQTPTRQTIAPTRPNENEPIVNAARSCPNAQGPACPYRNGFTACLFALTFIAAIINAVNATTRPDHDIITDLTYQRGEPHFSYSYVARNVNCHSNPEPSGFNNFGVDDEFNFNPYGCHQVKYRSPYH